MNRRQCLYLLVSCLLAVNCALSQEPVAPKLRLTVPEEFHAVPGMEMGIYFDNIVLTKTPLIYRFSVTCDIGNQEPRRWAVVPTAAQVGEHPVVVRVADEDGALIEQARTLLNVVPRDAGARSDVSLLFVGDSLTHATVYPQEVARLLSLPDNPSWQMLGTHAPKGTDAGVLHEGYGGWTWERFASKYEPSPDGTYRNRSSPFVFLGDNGKPALDVGRYFREKTDGKRPDTIIVLLGINDCFSADPDDPRNIDQRIDQMFGFAKKLIAAFRNTAPDAEIGICLTPPPNARDAAFEANYKGRYSRWGWKRIQHRLVERQLQLFSGREDEQLFVIPIELYLDPVDGYPANNGVHPNATGYKQIGASIYAWLKARMHARQHQ